jgi:hypothetical protein
MTFNLLVDTDVLIKCSCYSLLDQIQSPDALGGETGILGAARFVVRNYLERRGRINDRSTAQRRFGEYLREVTILEPTDEELILASAIEEAGVRLGLDLDVGESQLCAIAVLRAAPLLLTGDKRAILGAEALQEEMRELAALRGRVVCLEQALIGITARIGVRATRLKICAEPGVDRSLTVCFECHSSSTRSDFNADGLISYVHYLRERATTLLYALDAM